MCVHLPWYGLGRQRANYAWGPVCTVRVLGLQLRYSSLAAIAFTPKSQPTPPLFLKILFCFETRS